MSNNRRNDEREEQFEFLHEFLEQLKATDVTVHIEIEELSKELHNDKEFMDFAVNNNLNDPFKEDFGYSLEFNPFEEEIEELPSEDYVEGYTVTTDVIKEVIQELIEGICKEVTRRNNRLMVDIERGEISYEEVSRIYEFHEGTLDAVLDVLDFIEVSDEEE